MVTNDSYVNAVYAAMVIMFICIVTFLLAHRIHDEVPGKAVEEI